MPPRRPRNLRASVKSSLADWDDPAPENTNSDNKQSDAADTAKQPNTEPPTEPSTETATQETTPKIDIDDLRELQRLKRQRQRGLDIHALGKTHGSTRSLDKHSSKFNGSSSSEPTAISDSTNVDDTQGSQTARSLSTAFTAQTNKLDADKYMMEYIEKEMKRYRGSDDSQMPEKRVPDTDDLYQIPEHLRVVEKKPMNEGNVAMAAKMLTSIQEVDLGKGAKIRNIRETDRAVSQLAKSSGPRDTELGDMPARIGSLARSKRHADHPDRSSKASDDIVLQRFKKRMRR